jgi:hypothetical protein
VKVKKDIFFVKVNMRLKHTCMEKSSGTQLFWGWISARASVEGLKTSVISVVFWDSGFIPLYHGRVGF